MYLVRYDALVLRTEKAPVRDAGGRATQDNGDASAWWTNHGNDPVEGESVTHKITGNRLIDVEVLAAVSTLSYSSIRGGIG